MTRFANYIPRRWIASTVAVMAAAWFAGGCTPEALLIGAAAKTVVIMAEDRSLDDVATDAGITARILSAYADAGIDKVLTAVTVDVFEGRVLLIGNTESDEVRDQAVRIAWQIPNVHEVLNEIEVRDSRTIYNFSHDIWITTRMRSRVMQDPEIFGVNYTFNTNNGVLYIMGIAHDQQELTRIIAHGRDIPRVNRIVEHTRFAQSPETAADTP